MFDAKSLLGALLGGDQGAGQTGSTGAWGQSAAGSSSGGLWASQQNQSSGGGFLDTARQVAGDNPGSTVAAIGGLAALLLGAQGGSKVPGAGAMKVGGLAALGGLAYKLYQAYQEGQPQAVPAGGPAGFGQIAAPPQNSAFHQDSYSNDTALLILRAMVATAAADGVVDPSQRSRILGQMQSAGIDPAAAQFLDQEIRRPATAQQIASEVGGSQELGVQVYVASHLIADPTSPQERAFLANLASALGLSQGLVTQLDALTRQA